MSDPGPRITREWTSLGSKVIESNQGFDGPENQKDFWEGENFEVRWLAVWGWSCLLKSNTFEWIAVCPSL